MLPFERYQDFQVESPVMSGHEFALSARDIFRLSLLALLVFLPVPIALAEPATGELSMTLVWQMKLNVDGHITALLPIGDANRILREKLESDVRHWEFNPGKIDGKPAETETRLVVQLTLIPNVDGETYAIRLRDVRTGGYLEHASAPRVPDDQMGALVRSTLKKGGSVRVVLEVSYDGSGRTKNVELLPESTSTDAGFIHASRVAARKWRFRPERVGGKGIPGRLVLLTCFSVHETRASNSSDTDACHWTMPGSLARLGEGQGLALESSVHLVSDVIGKTL
jgi:hypothetical protein